MTAELNHFLQHHFGFSGFRPGQEMAIQHVLAGHHTLVVMPTGAGKSLIYQLAALHFQEPALVVSPLISLMKDQVDSLNRRGIAATYINSALSAGEQHTRMRAMAQGAFRLVYIAPERLRHRVFCESLQRFRVSLLAVDEAHCISQWGHDFRPDYLQLSSARKLLNHPTTVALTATATPQIQDEIVHRLGLPAAARIVTGFDRPNLSFEVLYTPDLESKYQALREFLKNTNSAGIIYVGTRRDTEEIAQFLRETLGLKAVAYHAGMDSTARENAQEAFMSGKIFIVVATNAFGMGVDRPDVRFVMHFTMPGTLEAYYQEAGRAGRDGLPARCVMLYSPEDRALQEWFIENDAPDEKELTHLHGALFADAKDDTVSLTVEALASLANLTPSKVKVGLAQLETIGAIHRLGDEGALLRLHLEALKLQELHTVMTEAQARRSYRRSQLQKMIAYAESNSCRRRIILDYFGDQNSAIASVCCDNCQARMSAITVGEKRQAETTGERIVLLILWTVQEVKQKLGWDVGRTKLIQILKGSGAKDMVDFHYDRLRAYGRLDQLRRADVEPLIRQLLIAGYLKSVGSDRPVLQLTPQGEQALQNKLAIPLQVPAKIRPGGAERVLAKREAGGTVALTGQLLAQGMSPAQIAIHRGLRESTIYEHIAQLIAEGTVEISAVVPSEVKRQVDDAIKQVGSTDALAPIKALLPQEISYGMIRCVIASTQRNPEVTR